MLRRKSNILMAALFVTAGFIAGCSDNDDNNGNGGVTGNVDNNGQTLAQIIQDDDDLSIFKDAVERAGLMEQLQNNGQYTVFAPTNEAFNLRYPSEEQLDALMDDSAALRDLLLYHMKYGRTESNALVGSSPIETRLPGTVIIADYVPGTQEEGEEDEEPAQDIRLNYSPARIVEPDINAKNGVIQKINRVLEIREGTSAE
ncbi:MAG: fasciclin domain-containing protein [Chitinispirillales bacterium]|jgi:transforming growth factor-beta-induced protein|nr:fasciclin domain-containing protein [Chitinispirillales bacterium]